MLVVETVLQISAPIISQVLVEAHSNLVTRIERHSHCSRGLSITSGDWCLKLKPVRVAVARKCRRLPLAVFEREVRLRECEPGAHEHQRYNCQNTLPHSE